VDIGPQYEGVCPISLVYPYEVSNGNIKVHEEG